MYCQCNCHPKAPISVCLLQYTSLIEHIITSKSFRSGYNSKHNIGNPHSGARAAFAFSEAKAIRYLISALVFSASEKPYPLKRRDRYLGQISFRGGWIATK